MSTSSAHGKPADVVDRDVAFAALDGTDVGPVQARGFCETLLGKSEGFSKPSKVRAHRTDEECYRCLECGEELAAERAGNNHPELLLRRIVEVSAEER